MARGVALDLIAAHRGGGESYTSEFNELFGPSRDPSSPESIPNLLSIIDALVLIGVTLAWLTTEEFGGVAKSPEETLARMDDAIDEYLRQLGKG